VKTRKRSVPYFVTLGMGVPTKTRKHVVRNSINLGTGFGIEI